MRFTALVTCTAASRCSRPRAWPPTFTVNSRCADEIGSVRAAAGMLFRQRREAQLHAGPQRAEVVERVGARDVDVQARLAVDRLAQGGQGVAGLDQAHVRQVRGLVPGLALARSGVDG